MAKIDKSLYTKAQWKLLKEERRQSKLQKIPTNNNSDIAFVLGNGVSRQDIDPAELQAHGPVYGCNAIYRTFSPDYLVAVDPRMVHEICKTGYQIKNKLWTNYQKSYDIYENINYFDPMRGWSSGPSALWLATLHEYSEIYILGFDYVGLHHGIKVNNIYVDTPNYKQSYEEATFYGNWLKQTKIVFRENKKVTFNRIIDEGGFNPKEFTSSPNYKSIHKKDFCNFFCKK
jgi:hypothetical protein